MNARMSPSGATPVGRSVPHESAPLHVSGKALYIDDLPEMAGTLHAAPGLSTCARGRIRAMDLSAVRAYPGVRCVLTAADIPGENNCGPILHDDPIITGDLVEFYGQVIFVVAAETREAARQAARLARVEYAAEPPILDMDSAIAAESWVLPPFVMTQGQPAGARSMNFEGLRRRGFSPERISAVKAMHKALYRDNLTLADAQLRIADIVQQTPEAQPDVQMMLDFLNGAGKAGIVRRRDRTAA